MTLQQLSYILELSRHNSISAAAHALNISQPSLSTAIKDLEKEFTTRLLNQLLKLLKRLLMLQQITHLYRQE